MTGQTKQVAIGTKIIEAPIMKPIPTLALKHPARIARQEYKLITVLQEARKLNDFVNSLNRKREYEND